MNTTSKERWDAPSWVLDAVFYQIFPDRFANGDPVNDPPNTVPWDSKPTPDNFLGGDLKGIQDHLNHLSALGVNAIYLTPIFRAGTNHRYDTWDYFAIDPALGTMETFQTLVNAVHQKGMRIILDAVFNHCGEGFWAFEDVKQGGTSSRYAKWFILMGDSIVAEPPNYQTCGGAFYLPKLNTRNSEVQEYLFNVATYWIREGQIDGWRLDVPWKIPIQFWQKFRRLVKSLSPELYILGEVWRNIEPWLKGDTFDGVMNYPLRSYILDYFINCAMDAEDFNYEIMLQQRTIGEAAYYLINLLGSHDTPRITTLCHNNLQLMRLTLIFLFTYIGVPMIYYGDEIGLQGGNDPECRGGMEWNKSKWNLPLLKLYQDLIALRHQHPALRRGSYEPLLAFNSVYAYRRHFEQDEIIVILNPRPLSYRNINVPLKVYAHKNKLWMDTLSRITFSATKGVLNFEILPAYTAYVLIPIS